MGFVEETGIAQFARDARIITIYEGTTGIQANDLVGRKILREGGETLFELIGELRTTVAELRDDADLASIADALAKNIVALEETTQWLLANGRDRFAEVLAGAVPFLHLLGTVCGSWQMARLALAARRALLGGEGDAGYHASLVELARFWMGTFAPQAGAHAETVREAGAALLAFDPAAF
jgi:acyl-CoA dehydrogenase